MVAYGTTYLEAYSVAPIPLNIILIQLEPRQFRDGVWLCIISDRFRSIQTEFDRFSSIRTDSDQFGPIRIGFQKCLFMCRISVGLQIYIPIQDANAAD